MIKLLVFDLDGTLAPIEKPVKDSTLKLLQEIEEKGIRIAIASGKTIYYLCGLFRQLPIKNPLLIGENGAIVQDGIHTPSNVCIKSPVSKDAQESIDKFRIKLINNLDYVFFQPNEIGLAFFAGRERTQQVEKLIDESIFKDITIYRHTDGYDITPSNINKGNALKMITDYYHIQPNEMISIGDGQNDVPMFEYTDISITLNNKFKATYYFQEIDEVLSFIKEKLI